MPQDVILLSFLSNKMPYVFNKVCVHLFFVFGFLSFMVNPLSIIILSLISKSNFRWFRWNQPDWHEKSGLPLFGPNYAQWYGHDRDYDGDDDHHHHHHDDDGLACHFLDLLW